MCYDFPVSAKMLDIQLRPLKDKIFDPSCRYISASIAPLHVTGIAFGSGLLSCYFAVQQRVSLSLLFWISNRALDCLDGALARHRNTASDLGGFLDLLGDFIVYALLPIAVAEGWQRSHTTFRAIALLEGTFFINNFILFFIAAITEKRAKSDQSDTKTKELTSLPMRRALIEGTESGILFTLMLAFPRYIEMWSLLMAAAVTLGICQRTAWTISALR